MLPIRLYAIGLSLVFLLEVLFTRGLGTLEAIVVTCPVLFVILDLRVEIFELKKLERQIALIELSHPSK